MIDHALVVGYGNTLRTDDGLGWHTAGRLADDPRLDGATVLQRHQLTPELALDISAASVVVLVDASHVPAAGTFTVERVEPASAAESTTWSHHVGPAGLVALARELYGRAPDVFVVSCGVASLAVGDRLSRAVEAAVPRLVDAVVGLVVAHGAAPRADRVSERSDA